MPNRTGKRLSALLLSLLLAALVLFSGCTGKPGIENTAAGPTSAAASASTPAVISSEEASVTETSPEDEPTSDTTAAESTVSAPASAAESEIHTTDESPSEPSIDENGSYYSKDDVALYLHIYGHLPDNFVTKKKARSAGWSGGSVEKYLPGCAIGGDRFGNNEGLLPEGEQYTECDINTNGQSSRGAERIVFTKDAEHIYYTGDHYASFEEIFFGD